MIIGVSIFARPVRGGGDPAVAAFLFLPAAAAAVVGPFVALSGTLASGLEIATAPDGAAHRLIRSPGAGDMLRLALGAARVGVAVPPGRKAYLRLDVGAAAPPLRLPPLGRAGLAWKERVLPPPPGVPAVAAVKPDVAVAPAAVKRLIDLHDLMSALDFVNQGLATGVVEPRITEGRIWLGLKGLS